MKDAVMVVTYTYDSGKVDRLELKEPFLQRYDPSMDNYDKQCQLLGDWMEAHRELEGGK